MVNEHNVNYPHSPFRVNLKDARFHIYIRVLVLYFFPEFLLNFVPNVHITLCFGNICGAPTTGKCILRVKKLKADVFTHVSPGKTLPRFFSKTKLSLGFLSPNPPPGRAKLFSGYSWG